MTMQPRALRMVVDMECARCKGLGVELLATIPQMPWRQLDPGEPNAVRFGHELLLERIPVEARCLTCQRTIKFGPVGSATA